MSIATRRKFLKACAVGAGGAVVLAEAVPQAMACMECLTEKLDGKYPIGKTRIAGDKVLSVSLTNEGASATPIGVPPYSAGEPMDAMKFLRAFDYGKVTSLAEGGVQ